MLSNASTKRKRMPRATSCTERCIASFSIVGAHVTTAAAQSYIVATFSFLLIDDRGVFVSCIPSHVSSVLRQLCGRATCELLHACRENLAGAAAALNRSSSPSLLSGHCDVLPSAKSPSEIVRTDVLLSLSVCTQTQLRAFGDIRPGNNSTPRVRSGGTRPPDPNGAPLTDMIGTVVDPVSASAVTPTRHRHERKRRSDGQQVRPDLPSQVMLSVVIDTLACSSQPSAAGLASTAAETTVDAGHCENGSPNDANIARTRLRVLDLIHQDEGEDDDISSTTESVSSDNDIVSLPDDEHDNADEDGVVVDLPPSATIVRLSDHGFRSRVRRRSMPSSLRTSRHAERFATGKNSVSQRSASAPSRDSLGQHSYRIAFDSESQNTTRTLRRNNDSLGRNGASRRRRRNSNSRHRGARCSTRSNSLEPRSSHSASHRSTRRSSSCGASRHSGLGDASGTCANDSIQPYLDEGTAIGDSMNTSIGSSQSKPKKKNKSFCTGAYSSSSSDGKSLRSKRPDQGKRKHNRKGRSRSMRSREWSETKLENVAGKSAPSSPQPVNNHHDDDDSSTISNNNSAGDMHEAETVSDAVADIAFEGVRQQGSSAEHHAAADGTNPESVLDSSPPSSSDLDAFSRIECVDHERNNGDSPLLQGAKTAAPDEFVANEQNDNKRVGSKKVKFSTLYLREYAICPGDNPAVTSGVPLSVGWEYSLALMCSIDDYEDVRPPRRRTYTEMRVPADHRRDMLRRLGFTNREIQLSTKRANIDRSRRRSTLETMPMAPMHATLERATRLILNATLRRKRKKKERELLQPYRRELQANMRRPADLDDVGVDVDVDIYDLSAAGSETSNIPTNKHNDRSPANQNDSTALATTTVAVTSTTDIPLL